MKKTWSLNTVHDLLTLSSPWAWVVLIWNVNYEMEKCLNIKLPDFDSSTDLSLGCAYGNTAEVNNNDTSLLVN